MPDQNSQAPAINQPPALTPDDHAANLALATHISTQLATPEQPQKAQNAPTGPEDVTQIDLAPQVESMQKEIDSLKKQVAQQPKDDIAEMRAMIEQALGEEDPNDGKQS